MTLRPNNNFLSPLHKRFILGALAILLFGALTHWHAFTSDYGFLDDWMNSYNFAIKSNDFYTTHALKEGRFIDTTIKGLFFENLLGSGVTSYKRARILSFCFIGFFIILTWRLFRQLNAHPSTSLCAAGGIFALPAIVVFVSWAVTASATLFLAFPIIAFYLVDKAFSSQTRTPTKALYVAISIIALMLTCQVYQPLICLYPSAALMATLWRREANPYIAITRINLLHFIFFFLILILGFIQHKILQSFANIGELSDRSTLNFDALQRAWWFVQGPAPRSFFLFFLPRLNFPNLTCAALALAGIFAIIASGIIKGFIRRRWTGRHIVAIAGFWLMSFSFLFPIKLEISVHRVLLPGALASWFLFIACLEELLLAPEIQSSPSRNRLQRTAIWNITCIILLICGGFISNHNSYRWLIYGAERETQRMRIEVSKIKLNKTKDIIFKAPQGRSSHSVDGEFGTISSAHGWVPRGLINVIYTEHHMTKLDKNSQLRVHWYEHEEVPPDFHLIDWSNWDPYKQGPLR